MKCLEIKGFHRSMLQKPFQAPAGANHRGGAIPITVLIWHYAFPPKLERSRMRRHSYEPRSYIECSLPVVGSYVVGKVHFLDSNRVSANRRAFMASSSVVKVSFPWMPGELPLSIAR